MIDNIENKSFSFQQKPLSIMGGITMKYVALFRGINVGGKNIVKMQDLKQLLLDLGFQQVNTYIQSGNVVFEAALEEVPLRDRIHTAFSERFGFESDVILRSMDEMDTLIHRLPFSAEEIAKAEAADPQVEHLYVYFLENPPEPSKLDAICRKYTGPDLFQAGEREIYLLCSESIRKSKLAIGISKAFDSATARNWKTVLKLTDMLAKL